MFEIDEFLEEVLCPSFGNCHFIKMFTKFLSYKNLYHTKGEVYLSDKLFKQDRLHFSPIGHSVLGKVLIAVANDPK